MLDGPMVLIQQHHSERADGDQILVTTIGETGPGGAHHQYGIVQVGGGQDMPFLAYIKFQEGTVPEAGVNGVTAETLLGVVHHYLRGLQSGDFPCWENQNAIECIKIARRMLEARTARRVAEKTEGKHEETPLTKNKVPSNVGSPDDDITSVESDEYDARNPGPE